MLRQQRGKKQIFAKITALLMAQALCLANFAYPVEVLSKDSLRVPISALRERFSTAYGLGFEQAVVLKTGAGSLARIKLPLFNFERKPADEKVAMLEPVTEEILKAIYARKIIALDIRDLAGLDREGLEEYFAIIGIACGYPFVKSLENDFVKRSLSELLYISFSQGNGGDYSKPLYFFIDLAPGHREAVRVSVFTSNIDMPQTASEIEIGDMRYAIAHIRTAKAQATAGLEYYLTSSGWQDIQAAKQIVHKKQLLFRELLRLDESLDPKSVEYFLKANGLIKELTEGKYVLLRVNNRSPWRVLLEIKEVASYRHWFIRLDIDQLQRNLEIAQDIQKAQEAEPVLKINLPEIRFIEHVDGLFLVSKEGDINLDDAINRHILPTEGIISIARQAITLFSKLNAFNPGLLFSDVHKFSQYRVDISAGLSNPRLIFVDLGYEGTTKERFIHNMGLKWLLELLYRQLPQSEWTIFQIDISLNDLINYFKAWQEPAEQRAGRMSI